jgi:diguanylate cyclase (GGDEF)-like protein
MSRILVLHERHSRLFLLLCFIPVTIFTYVHYLKENYILSGALLCTALVFAVNFKNIRNDEITKIGKVSIIISMWCCLALASYYVGIHGIVYSFPSIVGIFFLVPIRTALLISIPSLVVFLVLIMLHGEPIDSLRLASSLSLTIIFTTYSAYFSRQQQNAIDNESKKDPLTGLANRYAYNEWLNDCHLNADINAITSIHLDIDNFRTINDTQGFIEGDKLIQRLGKKLFSIMENSQVVDSASSHYLARFSGDSFAIAFTNLPEELDILSFVDRLKVSVSQLSIVSGHPATISVSVAVVRSTRKNGKFPNIIDNVDITLKRAKQLGVNSVQIFDELIEQQSEEQKYIAKELVLAMDKNQFNMVFMPIFRDNNKTIAGAELLVRCNRAELRNFGPDKFIPIAENFGLIERLDFWVLNESFKMIANTEILTRPNIEFYSINISSNQLRNKEFVYRIKESIEKYNIDPTKIELEITETSLVETDLQIIEMLISLRRIGFKLSLDDFGTGFTSFNQLKQYPLNCLKIDRSFVSGDTEYSTPVTGMSAVILSIAKLYNFNVIAEGVETEEQYLDLKNNGCLYFQGYWFSKPISLKDFVYMLEQKGY